jgi:hypothetical protein
MSYLPHLPPAPLPVAGRRGGGGRGGGEAEGLHARKIPGAAHLVKSGQEVRPDGCSTGTGSMLDRYRAHARPVPGPCSTGTGPMLDTSAQARPKVWRRRAVHCCNRKACTGRGVKKTSGLRVLPRLLSNALDERVRRPLSLQAKQEFSGTSPRTTRLRLQYLARLPSRLDHRTSDTEG